MTETHRFAEWRRRFSRGGLLSGLLCVTLLGCGSLLDVENPNNIKAEDIRLPAAGSPLQSGALARVARGVVGASLTYAVATDELEWSGSRDGWRELDEGKLSNAYNEFIDGSVGAGFPTLAAARWLADEAIKVLEEQTAAGTIVSSRDLARAYLWAAIAYVSIANMFDDFVLSDGATAAPPMGPDNMGSFYDTAIEYLNQGLAIATGRDAELALAITAMRARANFDRAIWDKVGRMPVATGLVNASSSYVTAAMSDAQAALAAAPSPSWRFQFLFNNETGESVMGSEINSRQEMRPGRTYVVPKPNSKTWYEDSTALRDPIDDIPAPAVHATQRELKLAERYPPYTVVSAREMYLILAEAALAAADTTGFQTAINQLRSIDDLSPWMPASTVTAVDLLIHARQANLYLQSRRLSDHYRFGVPSPEWATGSQASTTPGVFLPISAIECLANPHIGAARCST